MSFDVYDGQQQVDETVLVLFTTTDAAGVEEINAFTTGPSEIEIIPPVLTTTLTAFVPEAMDIGKVITPVVGTNSNVSFRFNPNNEFGKKSALGQFSRKVEVAIIKIAPDESTVVRWRGSTTKSVYTPEGITVTCISTLDTIKNKIRPRLISSFCPWGIYSSKCGEPFTDNSQIGDIESFSVNEGTIQVSIAVGGLQLPELFLGGMVSVGVAEVKSYIQDCVLTNGDASFLLTLVDPSVMDFIDLQDRDYISLARGCDKTVKTCVEVFENGEQYGGFPGIPRETAIRS